MTAGIPNYQFSKVFIGVEEQDIGSLTPDQKTALQQAAQEALKGDLSTVDVGSTDKACSITLIKGVKKSTCSILLGKEPRTVTYTTAAYERILEVFQKGGSSGTKISITFKLIPAVAEKTVTALGKSVKTVSDASSASSEGVKAKPPAKKIPPPPPGPPGSRYK